MGSCTSKCFKKLKIYRLSRVQQQPKATRKMSIKEVYNLFLVIDYLALRDLLRVGQVSR